MRSLALQRLLSLPSYLNVSNFRSVPATLLRQAVVPPLWAVVALLSCLVPAAHAAGPASVGQAADAAADARAWLTRIHSAASTGNYQGTMVFTAVGMLSSSRVSHYTMGEQVVEQMEALDGRQQRIVRFNDSVHTLWPQTRVAVVEKREMRAAWSTTPQEVDPQALEQYELRREGAGRVAGRKAFVFLLEPRDTLRYAQRLWSDQATGLMLRADVMTVATTQDAQPVVLESTAFSEVAIGTATRPQPDALQQLVRNLRKLDGYRVVRPQLQPTTLEAEGWALAQPVAGFRLAGCVRRGMETAGDGEPVLQTVFSDGLTHVSLFVEPFKPQRHTGEIQAQQGATGTLTLRRGDYWVTAVGDVPLSTLKLFAEALTRRR